MKPKTAVIALALLVVSATIVAVVTQSEDTPEIVNTITSTVLIYSPTATTTKAEIPTQIPTNTVTASPAATYEPTQTPSPTETPTPTVLFTATPRTGFTFYGSQLEFMRENFGWFYEVIGCAQGYSGVGNVYTADPKSCVRLVPSKGERVTKAYLLMANYWYFAPGSGMGVPQRYMLYFFEDAHLLFDGIDYWLDIGYDATIGIFVDEVPDLYEQVTSQYGIDVNFGGLTLPHKVIPLTEEEYEVVVSMPGLFPVWVETLK